MADPTPQRLHELFCDAGTTLVRKVPKGKAKAGAAVTGTNGAGYLRVRVDGAYQLVHRLLWIMRHGPIPAGLEIDHRDGQTAHNVDGNLRLASHTQNMHNRRKHKHNRSGHTGVSKHAASGKWIVQINHAGKAHYGGLFNDFSEACRKVDAMRDALHGEFIRRED